MRTTIFIALLLLMLGTQTQAQNLIQNGKFANKAEGWSLFSANDQLKSIEVSSDYVAYGLAEHFAGQTFVELDAQSAIQQKINTQKGNVYTLGFSFAHRPNAGEKQLIVQVDDKTVFSQTIPNNQTPGIFTYTNFSFTASNESSKVVFYVASLSGDLAKGVLLRDVFCELESEIDLKLYYSY